MRKAQKKLEQITAPSPPSVHYEDCHELFEFLAGKLWLGPVFTVNDFSRSLSGNLRCIQESAFMNISFFEFIFKHQNYRKGQFLIAGNVFGWQKGVCIFDFLILPFELFDFSDYLFIFAPMLPLFLWSVFYLPLPRVLYPFVFRGDCMKRYLLTI